MAHPIKVMLYHHSITAFLYNIIRNYRRDKYNKMSDEEFAQWQYKNHTGKKLDLKTPKTFDEKIWYLKLHEREPLQTLCTDKYEVRDYVKKCGLECILNEVYGVYESFDEIPFQTLPDKFFLKCTHTSGTNAIFDREVPFDYRYQKREFDYWMKRNYFWGSREWNYKHIPPRIICEKILTDKEGKLPMDYKFMCFNGRVEMLFLNIGLATSTGEHADDAYCNIYDREYQLLPITDERENYLEKPIPKPKKWDDMIKYAEILSKPFRHCRVDFYDVDGDIYFGEITFHHGGGCNGIEPEEWAYKMGEWIDISNL